MASLENIIMSGRIVEVMLVFIVLEIVFVEVYRRRRGGGVSTVPLLVNIGAGGSLMLALRAALTDAGWQWIAAYLLAALAFHVADLAIRWHPAR